MMRAHLACALVVLASPAALPAASPRLVLGPHAVRLGALPPVLGQASVERHLTTGLTTGFLLEVDVRAGRERRRGAAEVDVRYDLWDERFLVSVRDVSGRRPPAIVAPAELPAFWSGLELAVLPAGDLPAGPLRARVRLTVLPFSEDERRDTEAWFLQAVRDPGGERPPRPAPAARDSNVTTLLLATSIGRRSLITFDWEAAVERAPQ